MFSVMNRKPVDWLTWGQTQTRALAQLHYSVLLSELRLLLSQRLPPPVVRHLRTIISRLIRGQGLTENDSISCQGLSHIHSTRSGLCQALFCVQTQFLFPKITVIVKTSAPESFCKKHPFINASSPHLFLGSHRNENSGINYSKSLYTTVQSLLLSAKKWKNKTIKLVHMTISPNDALWSLSSSYGFLWLKGSNLSHFFTDKLLANCEALIKSGNWTWIVWFMNWINRFIEKSWLKRMICSSI